MDANLKKQIGYANQMYAAMLGLLILIGAAIAGGAFSLWQSSIWTDHTGKVQSAFNELETEVARTLQLRQSPIFDNQSDYQAARQKTLVSAQTVAALVADSATQSKNVNRLIADISARYAAQDVYFSSFTAKPHGAISFSDAEREKALKTQEQLIGDFYVLKTTENQLLFERLGQAGHAQIRLVELTIILLLIQIVVCTYAWKRRRQTLWARSEAYNVFAQASASLGVHEDGELDPFVKAQKLIEQAQTKCEVFLKQI